MVKRVKTAFQFFQCEKMAEVKRQLGPGATMGETMTEISSRWKMMSETGREEFLVKESEDRIRYQHESAEADARAAAIQKHRRNNLVVREGEDVSSRGARMKVAMERKEEEQRKRKRKQDRLNQLSPEEIAERKRLKAQKKAETVERQRKREAQDKALADRHKKLDKIESKKSAQRLEYLLKQSSIFAKLKKGGTGDDDVASAAAEEAAPTKGQKNGVGSKHLRNAEKGRGGGGGGGEDEDDEEGEEHVFLTKQPMCMRFGQLKPYQLEGLNWMIHLAEKGLNGILADEMGLGKTVQSISILAYHYDYLKINGPHLVCVPKSTLSNWMNELKRWCPALRPIRFHGKREEREELVAKYFTNEAASHDGFRPSRQKEKDGEMVDDNSDNPRKWDVCVTTYEVCNTERKVLEKFAWKYLIIDEAHRLKNEASIFSKTVRSVKTNHRLLLTGTPLQNNLHELWALLNFLLPDIFSSADQFDEWFNLEIDDENAKKEMISQLHKILRPFMIRRLKSDVAKGLPPKTETLIMVGMSKMQKQLYKKLLLRDIDSITSSKSGGSKNKTAILNIVMQLRKCCGHPYLFEGVEDRSLDPLGQHLVDNCGKLTMVDKLLKKLKERGSRVLIFTQMTRILDILEDFMHMRGYKYCRIDGNTDYDSREAAIDAFNRPNSEKFCFILSTRAGGLGINLQTADTCILYDSDWNPQADLQAQDRCHRLGQKKPVNIYRLVSENTVEEKIVERAQQKLKLDAMVVQQGRLKDKDKVSKEEIMAAVRFGADTVFRSEESTITDEDIDVILERGAAKTKELKDRIQKADKGDIYDFRLDAGISSQKFEGVDYSDRELRNQLRLLAADSMGKRERRAPPTNYNPIIAPKKSMIVNNQKIKLPRSLRLPRMEDHHFYNRERLLELGKLEFETYATLKQLGQLPPREVVEKSRTLLPPELAREKLELLEEGFGDWTRSQYFSFVKAAAKYGRDDIAAISAEMDVPENIVSSYSESFWKYGAMELKKDEWERVKANIEKGEQKIAKKRKLSALLEKFVSTFENPRQEMTFANKGTAHFSLEQDRALLSAVDKFGYGNWDAVREELRHDDALRFQHSVQGMNCDMIGKRCDYRMRQMEKELESRVKSLTKEKPAGVLAAERTIEAIREMDDWERGTMELQMRGKSKGIEGLGEEAKEIMGERLAERKPWIDRIREIEIQVRDCKALAQETRKAIIRGDQYVNYSNITLKAGGPHTMGNNNAAIAREIAIEEKINPVILRVPACMVCEHCLDKNSKKLCVKRLEKRMQQLKHASTVAVTLAVTTNGSSNKKAKKTGSSISSSKKSVSSSSASTKKPSSTKTKKPPVPKKPPRPSIGENNRGNPLGNKKMAVPDELIPELCRRIGPHGTNERMKLINQFVKDHPMTSIRQVTIKFSDVVTKIVPGCIPPPEKKSGRSFNFFLRPKFYRMIPEEDRPKDWERYAREDDILWKGEMDIKVKAKEKREKRIKELLEDDGFTKLSETSSLDPSGSPSVMTPSIQGDDESDIEKPAKKKLKKVKKKKKMHKK